MTVYQRKMVIVAIQNEIYDLTVECGQSENSKRVEALRMAVEEIESIGK